MPVDDSPAGLLGVSKDAPAIIPDAPAAYVGTAYVGSEERIPEPGESPMIDDTPAVVGLPEAGVHQEDEDSDIPAKEDEHGMSGLSSIPSMPVVEEAAVFRESAERPAALPAASSGGFLGPASERPTDTVGGLFEVSERDRIGPTGPAPTYDDVGVVEIMDSP
jgi:hypothetical protein